MSGRTPEYHDLSQISQLRSHGGLHEALVPLIVNRPLTPETMEALQTRRLHNYDLFDVLCNGVVRAWDGFRPPPMDPRLRQSHILLG